MFDFEKSFETPGPITLRVEVQRGDVTLTASEVSTTRVRLIPHDGDSDRLTEGFTVQARGDEVVVLAPKGRENGFGFGRRSSVDVEVELPVGSAIDVKTGSGDVTARGLLARVEAASGSGDLTFEDVDAAELTSGSGDITTRAVRGGVKAKTGSGDLTLESVGDDADLVAGSGDIQLRRADGEVTAKTGSGDIGVGASSADLTLMTGTGDVKLGAVHGGAVRAKTGTGDVAIAVATGVAAYLDLNTVTGDVKVDLDEADGPEGSESQASLTVHSGKRRHSRRPSEGKLVVNAAEPPVSLSPHEALARELIVERVRSQHAREAREGHKGRRGRSPATQPNRPGAAATCRSARSHRCDGVSQGRGGCPPCRWGVASSRRGASPMVGRAPHAAPAGLSSTAAPHRWPLAPPPGRVATFVHR